VQHVVEVSALIPGWGLAIWTQFSQAS